MQCHHFKEIRTQGINIWRLTITTASFNMKINTTHYTYYSGPCSQTFARKNRALSNSMTFDPISGSQSVDLSKSCILLCLPSHPDLISTNNFHCFSGRFFWLPFIQSGKFCSSSSCSSSCSSGSSFIHWWGHQLDLIHIFLFCDKSDDVIPHVAAYRALKITHASCPNPSHWIMSFYSRKKSNKNDRNSKKEFAH